MTSYFTRMLLSSKSIILKRRDQALSNSGLLLSNNMKWLYKSWESKFWGCAELMIHPYWVHLDKICLRSVKHLIKKFWAIKRQWQRQILSFSSCDIIIHSENWTLWYHYCLGEADKTMPSVKACQIWEVTVDVSKCLLRSSCVFLLTRAHPILSHYLI